MYYWTLFKIIFTLLVPVPISPKITRASQATNTWILTCEGFTSVFEEAKKVWKSPQIVSLLKKYDEPRPATPPRTRRASIRPSTYQGVVEPN